MLKHLLAAAALFITSPAFAQQMPCDKPMKVLTDLAEKHHETVVAAGQIDGNSGLVVTAAPDGSTWTAVVMGREIACVTAAGKDWTKVEPGK